MKEEPLGKSIKTVALLMGRRLRQTGQQLGGEGFTFRQGQIIHFLRLNEGRGDLFQRDVEEEFSIRRPTATGILQNMEKNGLLRRESVPYDQRLKKLVLTQRARALDATVDATVAEVEETLARGSTPEELALTRTVLERMIANLREG